MPGLPTAVAGISAVTISSHLEQQHHGSCIPSLQPEFLATTQLTSIVLSKMHPSQHQRSFHNQQIRLTASNNLECWRFQSRVKFSHKHITVLIDLHRCSAIASFHIRDDM